MEKLPRSRGIRKVKGSNVGAVGVVPHGTPGDEQRSPHGSNARQRVLTIRHRGECWEVVQHEYVVESMVGSHGVRPLPLVLTTVLVYCDTVLDAAHELLAWSHGLGVPWCDMGENVTHEAPVTYDPAAGWPL